MSSFDSFFANKYRTKWQHIGALLGHMHTFYDYWLLIYDYEAVEDFVSWMEQ
jgi:hypothetical protein